MPDRKHHNLEGVLRDLRHAEQLELPIWWEFCDFARLAVESTMVTDEDDDGDDTADGDSPDVDGDESADGEDDVREPRRHDAGSEAHRNATRGMGRLMGDVPGRVGAEAEPGLQCVRVRTVGAPVERVTATTARPAARKTPSRKGVTRGTRKKARK